MDDTNKKNKKDSSGGVALALVVATAAAGYFLYGKNGARHRAKLKGWMLKIKGEALEKMESLKEIDEEKYYEILARIGEKYAKKKDIASEEVASIIDEMKGHWKSIQKDIEAKNRKAKRTVKRTVKRAVAGGARKKATTQKKTNIKK